jgi:hypothetical protein
VQGGIRQAHGDLTTMLPDNVIQGRNGRWYTRNQETVLGRFDGWPDRSTAEEAMRVIQQEAIPNYSAGQWFSRMNSPVFQSERLNEAGIPGIRYLDQGSRGAGEGTRNYVVFQPEIIEILRRYGIAGPVGGSALLSQYSPPDEQ